MSLRRNGAVQCDAPGCRRWTPKGSDRFEMEWEVWGTTMDVFDFCSEEHFRNFYAAHPEWHNQ